MYSGVRQRRDLGVSLKWPTPPAVLKPFVQRLQQVIISILNYTNK
jgi:hypothetical protein